MKIIPRPHYVIIQRMRDDFGGEWHKYRSNVFYNGRTCIVHHISRSIDVYAYYSAFFLDSDFHFPSNVFVLRFGIRTNYYGKCSCHIYSFAAFLLDIRFVFRIYFGSKLTVCEIKIYVLVRFPRLHHSIVLNVSTTESNERSRKAHFLNPGIWRCTCYPNTTIL